MAMAIVTILRRHKDSRTRIPDGILSGKQCCCDAVALLSAMIRLFRAGFMGISLESRQLIENAATRFSRRVLYTGKFRMFATLCGIYKNLKAILYFLWNGEPLRAMWLTGIWIAISLLLSGCQSKHGSHFIPTLSLVLFHVFCGFRIWKVEVFALQVQKQEASSLLEGQELSDCSCWAFSLSEESPNPELANWGFFVYLLSVLLRGRHSDRANWQLSVGKHSSMAIHLYIPPIVNPISGAIYVLVKAHMAYARYVCATLKSPS